MSCFIGIPQCDQSPTDGHVGGPWFSFYKHHSNNNAWMCIFMHRYEGFCRMSSHKWDAWSKKYEYLKLQYMVLFLTWSQVVLNYLSPFHPFSYTGICTCLDSQLTVEESLPCCQWVPVCAQRIKFMSRKALGTQAQSRGGVLDLGKGSCL